MTDAGRAYETLHTWLYGYEGEPPVSAYFWIALLAQGRPFREEVKALVKPGQSRITEFINELAPHHEEAGEYLFHQMRWRDCIGQALDAAGLVTW